MRSSRVSRDYFHFLEFYFQFIEFISISMVHLLEFDFKLSRNIKNLKKSSGKRKFENYIVCEHIPYILLGFFGNIIQKF